MISFTDDLFQTPYFECKPLQTRLIVPILAIFVNSEKLKHFGRTESISLKTVSRFSDNELQEGYWKGLYILFFTFSEILGFKH